MCVLVVIFGWRHIDVSGDVRLEHTGSCMCCGGIDFWLSKIGGCMCR